MKKALIISAVFLLPLATFGATQAVKEIKSYDFVAQVLTDDAKNVKVFKYEDTANKTNCYIAYTSGWTNGNNTNISCVVVK